MNSGTVAAISAALLLSLVASHSAQAQLQPLPTRHTRDAVTQKQVTAMQRLDRGQIMHLGLALKLRDRAGLEAFLGNLYNPSSPNYRKYLSVQEFANMFGPSEADQAAVASVCS
jgi:kumamolisin